MRTVQITIACTRGGGGGRGGEREREVGQTSINTTDNVKEIFRCTSDIYVSDVHRKISRNQC